MTIADKIIALRKKRGWFQKELAEILDVSRQSISKWESGQAIPDMNRVIRMSEIFGVTTDYLLKDNLESPEFTENSHTVVGARSVSIEEALAFLSGRNLFSGRLALGVLMCIVSPVALILLEDLRQGGRILLARNTVVGIGWTLLILLVSGAVSLFVISRIRNQKYACLKTEPIETDYGVTGICTGRRERYKSTYIFFLVLGIVLIVLSAIPVFVALTLFGNDVFSMPVANCIMLILIATGIFMIIRVNIVWGTFQILLEEGNYTRDNKESEKKAAPVETIYWLAVIVIFLAYSLITGNWARSWIIWPVAGIGYGIIHAVFRVLHRKG